MLVRRFYFRTPYLPTENKRRTKRKQEPLKEEVEIFDLLFANFSAKISLQPLKSQNLLPRVLWAIFWDIFNDAPSKHSKAVTLHKKAKR